MALRGTASLDSGDDEKHVQYLMSDERMMPFGRRRRIMKRPGVAFFLWNIPAYFTRMSMSSLPISSLQWVE